MNELFIRVQEKQYGPFSSQELRAIAGKGEFQPSDWVWHEEEGEWVQASDMRELRHLFEGNGKLIEDRSKRIIAVGGGKGGVGKSFFAVNFVQFLKDKGIAHVAIDSDNENSTLKRFHSDTRFLDLEKRRELDHFRP